MFRLLRLDHTLLELLKLDARYVNELSRVTREFLRESTATLCNPLRVREDRSSRGIEPRTPSPPRAPLPLSMPPPQPAKQIGAIIVLEEEAGQIAQHVFTMQNYQNYEVIVRLEASQFLDPPAPGLSPNVSFDPKEVRLGPLAQESVRIMAFIDHNLQPNVLYKFEVTAPALGGTFQKIPAIILRTPLAGTPEV